MDISNDSDYDFMDSLQVPWFIAESASKTAILSYRHHLTWDISHVDGVDAPNSSSESLNMHNMQYLKTILSVVCNNMVVKCNNPLWLYWNLNELRMTSDSVETNRELDFLCIDTAGEFWVERLKNHTMTMHYCLPNQNTPLSRRIGVLHNFFFRYCTQDGAKIATTKTTSDNDFWHDIVQQWHDVYTTVDAVVFLPATCVLGYQLSVANAVADMGGTLECLFKEDLQASTGFFVISIKGQDLKEYQKRMELMVRMAERVSQTEMRLRNVLLKHHSLEMYNRLVESENRLMNDDAMEFSESIRAISQQMLGTSLGFFPENNFEMFKDLLGRMGEVSLARMSRGIGNRNMFRIRLIRDALLKAARRSS